MKGWSLKNYHSYIREIRKREDLTLKEARAAYRAQKEALGRPVFKVDIKRDPSVTKESVNRGKRHAATATRQQARKRTDAAAASVDSGGGAGKVSQTIADLDQFYAWYDESLDYEYAEYDSSLDYEEPA